MELRVNGARAADVSVYARLTDGKGKIYGARKFDASVPADSAQPNDVYRAFDAAFDRVIADMVAWSYEAGENARAGA